MQRRDFTTLKTSQIRVDSGGDDSGDDSGANFFSLVEKHKFPLPLFTDGRWSRKGFLRSRWRLRGTAVDLVNVHLFHDASNLVSVEAAPSVYCSHRHMALGHLLDHLAEDAAGHSRLPFFVFGDFNYRLEGKDVLKRLTRGLSRVEGAPEGPGPSGDGSVHPLSSSDDLLQYVDQGNAQVVLSIGKKEFRLQGPCLGNAFTRGWQEWRKYDRELSLGAGERLEEMPLNFPPTYPFVEDPGEGGGGGGPGSAYMETRCPAWCDRVLLSHPARALLATKEKGGGGGGGGGAEETDYDVVGRDACMGDHKPVYLRFRLKAGAGDHQPAAANCHFEKAAGLRVTSAQEGGSLSRVGPTAEAAGVPYSRYVEIKDVGHAKLFKETTV